MPDVVVIKERKQDAVPVMLARLRWGFLRWRRETNAAARKRSRRSERLRGVFVCERESVQTCHVLRPWKKK